MSAKVEGFDDLIKQLDQLQDQSYVDQIAVRAVGAASPLVERSVKDSIRARTKSGTGLVNSFVPSEPKKNQYGVYSVVRPVGADEKGTRYGAIAAYLEYGTSRGQEAKPWRQAAVNAAEKQAVEAMEAVIEEAINDN